MGADLEEEATLGKNQLPTENPCKRIMKTESKQCVANLESKYKDCVFLCLAITLLSTVSVSLTVVSVPQ